MQSISFILASGCPATSDDALSAKSHCDLQRSKAGVPESPFKGVLLGARHRASEGNPLPSCSATAELDLTCVTRKSLDFSKRDLVSFLFLCAANPAVEILKN